MSNMHDGRIWRVSVPDGNVVGSFPFGAAGEPRAADVLPFGLGFHDGWLYHGVIDPTGASIRVDEPAGLVYRSRRDGSEMRLVAFFNQGPAVERWLHDGAALSDIEFDRDGNPILGLRSRGLDTSVAWYGRAGDLYATRPGGAGWRILNLGHYRDRRADIGSITMGGLASVPGLDRVVSTAFVSGGRFAAGDGSTWVDPDRLALVSFDNLRGEPLTRVDVFSVDVTVDASGPVSQHGSRQRLRLAHRW